MLPSSHLPRVAALTKPEDILRPDDQLHGGGGAAGQAA